MSDTGWGILFLLGIIAAVALIISISVWQVFRTQQTHAASKVALTHDGAYRALAEETSLAIRKSTEQQERMAAELAELRARLTTVERLLKDVG
jgi:hypothetical protein